MSETQQAVTAAGNGAAAPPPALAERGMTLPQWRVLKDAIFPGASKEAIFMAVDYCKARNLDVFKRPVHIVSVWNSAARANVETVWPGIAELRTTAMRTKKYAGCDPAEFGPINDLTFRGSVKGKEGWSDKTVTLNIPEWCQITLYRLVDGKRVAFPGPRVYWLETYASFGRAKSDDDLAMPNTMWQRRVMGQLEKCAEAGALRKAFPEELGGDLTADEMAGQHIGPDNAKDITGASETPARPTRSDFTENGDPAPAAAQTGMDAVVVAGQASAEPLYALYDNSGELVGELPPAKWADELTAMLRTHHKSGDIASFDTVWDNAVETLADMAKAGTLGNPEDVREIHDQLRAQLERHKAPAANGQDTIAAHIFADTAEAETFIAEITPAINGAASKPALDAVLQGNLAKLEGLKKEGRWGTEQAATIETLRAGRAAHLSRHAAA